jgi:hypothetical protein
MPNDDTEFDSKMSDTINIGIDKAFNLGISAAIKIVREYREAGYDHYVLGAIVEKLEALKKSP